MLGRSLLMKASGSLLLYPAYVQDYLDRVTAKDVQGGNSQGLERGVTDGFNVALQDLVADTSLGISGSVIAQAASKIKAMPFMCGARTLLGCLEPVVGPAPTRFGTEGGWNYNRKTGLAGNGTDNYLNSNRANNADPQNNVHTSVYVSTARTSSCVYMGCDPGERNTIYALDGNNIGFSLRQLGINYSAASLSTTGFIGQSRSNSANFVGRVANASNTFFASSTTPSSTGTFLVFARFEGGVVKNHSNGRISSYSIGESLDLAILNARITALMNDLASAIP
jgi:hypothetical protein